MIFAFVAAATVAVPKPTPIDPVSWFSASDYPLEALKKGIGGSVTFDLTVDRDGKPTSCRIVASSGFEVLDQATCKAALSKAKFTPAIGADGQAVASHYTHKATWRLPTAFDASYRAVILDYQADPLHPLCTIQSKDDESGSPTCTELESKLSAAGLAQKIIKFVYLHSSTPSDESPYRGELDWGRRISYLAADQYYVKGAFPIACITVAAEGPPGADPCSGFPGPLALSDAEKQKATHTRVETSLFAIVRPPSAQTPSTKSP